MRGVVLVDTLLLFLPVTVSGYLPSGTTSPSWFNCCGGKGGRWRSSAAASSRDAYTRLCLNKEDLPDETVRQMAAANQRVKELEEEYLKSLDADEIAIERKWGSGLACMKVPGMLEKAEEYFRSAAELRCASLCCCS